MSDLITDTLEYFKTDYPDIEYLKEIKSGKEATVHLVQSRGEALALKIYKPHAQNAERGLYMSTEHLDSRTKRAIFNRSKRGKQMEKSMWTDREFRVLRDLNNLGANVPKVYAHSDNAILMQFLGEGANPAPRLTEITLTKSQAREVFQILLRTIVLLLEINMVHGDLSAYNILWFEEKPYIIDFPQALELRNSSAYAKLNKDLDNMNSYFRKYIDVDMAAELDAIVS
jgi:RIO kinase 1